MIIKICRKNNEKQLLNKFKEKKISLCKKNLKTSLKTSPLSSAARLINNRQSFQEKRVTMVKIDLSNTCKKYIPQQERELFAQSED